MPPNYQYPAPQSKRKLIALIVIFGALVGTLVIGLIILSNALSKKTVLLEPAANTTIALGLLENSEGPPAVSQTLIETSSPNKIKVEPGWYGARFSGEGLETKLEQIEIKEDMTITSPILNYTPERLNQLLEQQGPTIQQTFMNRPELAGYRVAYQKLYQQADWYAAVLMPPNPQTQDILRIILHKKDNAWQVAAGPSIIFYIGNYPDVPQPVIRNVNNQQPS